MLAHRSPGGEHVHAVERTRRSADTRSFGAGAPPVRTTTTSFDGVLAPQELTLAKPHEIRSWRSVGDHRHLMADVRHEQVSAGGPECHFEHVAQ